MSNIDTYSGEKVNAISSTYKWTLENFRVENFKEGEGLLSPIFTTGVPNNKFKWQFQFYPRVRTRLNSDTPDAEYFSLYLKSLDELTIEPKFAISVINEEEKIVLINYSCIKRPEFSHIMSNSALKRGKTYSIICDITISKNDQSLFISEQRKTHFKLDSFEKLMENDEYSDVTLIVAGRTFLAHKCILSFRSPVFAAMFRHNMKEKENKTVIIDDIDPDAFKEMLRFIYAGIVDDIKNLALNLFIAADKYSLDSLKDICVQSLIDTISTENATKYLEFSDLYHLDELKKKVLDFIIRVRKEIRFYLRLKELSESGVNHLIKNINQLNVVELLEFGFKYNVNEIKKEVLNFMLREENDIENLPGMNTLDPGICIKAIKELIKNFTLKEEKTL